MPLQTIAAVIGSPATVATFLIPGHQIWTPRSVRATAARGAGGTPNRAYSLTITNGLTALATVGANDDGTDPGTCDVTFANTPAASVGVGSLGITVAPLGPFRLPAGYVITLLIENAVTGDAWTDAVCWTDYEYSA